MPRMLGNTDLEVTPIGLGLAALGRPGYINLGHASDLAGHTDVESMERAAARGARRRVRRGRSLLRRRAVVRAGRGVPGELASERGLSPDDVTVGSKWGYTYTADWHVDAKVNEVKDLSVATLRRQIDESQELLGDHLELYQIHSATVESGVLDDPEVLFELGKLRASGMAIGFTATGPHQAETIERALEVGGFDAVQATWNLLERSAGPRAGGGARRRPGGDRQGGARERPADHARRRARAGRGRAHRRHDARTRSRSQRSSRSRGWTSCSAAPPPWTSFRATWWRSRSTSVPSA